MLYTFSELKRISNEFPLQFSLNHKIKRANQNHDDAILAEHLENKLISPKHLRENGTISHKRAQRLLWAAHDMDQRTGLLSHALKDKDSNYDGYPLGVTRLPGSGKPVEVYYHPDSPGKSIINPSSARIVMNSGNAYIYNHELSHNLYKPKGYFNIMNHKTPEGQINEADIDLEALGRNRRLGDWKNKRNSPLIKDVINTLYDGESNLAAVEPYRYNKLKKASENQKIEPWMLNNIHNNLNKKGSIK